MKKFFISILMLSPFLSYANPGCGLGGMIFEGQTGKVPHILAATTNGISGNQTFGMTTGTLGCETTAPIKVAAFVDANQERLALDISRGSGNHLSSLRIHTRSRKRRRKSF